MAKRERPDKRNDLIRAKLSSLNTTAVSEAQLELRSLPPAEAVAALVGIIEHDRSNRRLIWFQVLVMLLVGLAVYWAFNLLGHQVSPQGAFSGVFSGLFMVWLRSKTLRANSASLLLQFDDPRLIDALVMSYKNGTRSFGPEKALTRLLPMLVPAQAHLVSRESRTFLNHALLHNTNKEFVLAILAAWEQIGDRDAIPTVEQLAGAGGFVEKDATIREAAIAALPAIRASAIRAAISETLLRPADADENTALLRPATSADAPEELLLRPSSEQ